MPQPGCRRPRRRSASTPHRAPAGPDRGLRHLARPPPRRAGRLPQTQVGAAQTVAAHTTGLLRIDRAAAAREAHYDGKWLLRTSDPTLTAEDLAAAYKQLIAVERGWRDCKTSLGLRPVYHHREDRIRAHVQLCWLALLLIRVAETRAGDTWRNLRHELDRMHLVTLATADGRVAQRSALTSGHKTILAALDLPEPPRYLDFTPGNDAAAD